MKPFAISVTHCDLDKSGDTVSKQQIESAIRRTHCETNARQRIAAIIRQARQKRDEAHHQAERILQAAHQNAEQLESTWREQAQQQAIKESVSWLVEQGELERSLIENLKGRIRQQVRNVIEQWSTEQDISQFLVKRIGDQIATQTTKQSLTLFVPQEHYSTMEQEFGEHLNVQIKTELNRAQAELSSNSLVVRIDLDQQLRTLLDSFSHPSQQSTA
ncbi:type III secretion protein [Vibrio coralliilyticus]|uniref:type III secretion protein n=1 Tax=Vibrio coralliilyticus TaxID=190893 RepID=UPI001560E5DA|nr:type III secretion protein [Vibrio coralliilyticus]NRF25946.1 type III secretion protein [Vibrio coralliilyticus]NRF80115.1 type III secretion protein [Vibrio coralliilyticus]